MRHHWPPLNRKNQLPAHIRGWGTGVHHGPPFSKRRSGLHRRQERRFVRADKQLNLRGE